LRDVPLSRPGADRFLRVLLAAVVVLPPLVVFGGTEAGVPFTMYREPKLTALGLLGWSFVVAFLAVQAPRLRPGAVRRTLRKPFFAVFLAFLAYSGASLAWVRVPENHLYEWSQYLLLFVLTACLDAWAAEAEGIRRIVRLGLIVSLVPAVLVGYLQLAGAFPFLVPIDPGYGVRHASLMGYKNPMALAVVGQLFLLAGVVGEVLRSRRRFAVRLLVATYGAAVLLYLATLQSRTAVVATTGAAAVVAALHAARYRRLPGGSPALALLLAGALTVGAVVVASPALRARFASIGSYLARPATLLDTDRGVYLRNTLAMVADRPFGVGLGDWQTWYPVYRRYDRYRSFDETFQVRRAHGDHVQVLGELGGPGLVLWWALLAAALAPPLRRFWREGGARDLLLVGQLAAFVLAMTADYLVELPYHKLQLFLVCFLAVASAGGAARAGRRSELPKPSRRHRAGRLLAVAALALLGLLQVGWYAGLGWRSVAAARLEVSYRAAPRSPSAAAEALARRDRLGRRFTAATLPGCPMPLGHAKTFFRAYLVLAHDAAARGDLEGALDALRHALALHPFHPGALRLCSEILRQAAPAEAQQCAEIHDYVLDEASEGFDRPYPWFLKR
jgi:O-antigen ligase